MTELVTWILASLSFAGEKMCCRWSNPCAVTPTIGHRSGSDPSSRLSLTTVLYYIIPFCSSLGLPWNPYYGSHCGVFALRSKTEASCHTVGGGLSAQRSTSLDLLFTAAFVGCTVFLSVLPLLCSPFPYSRCSWRAFDGQQLNGCGKIGKTPYNRFTL
jgi:hypothetical protein